MAVSVYHFDTRIRRRHIPLISQQRRLRHLRSISARNIIGIDPDESALAFTLHRRPDSNEFYTSETSDSLNPSWKEFESSNFPENVDTALSFVCVKVWNMKDEKQLLVEWVVFLSGLVFLGEQIPKEGKNFKPNTLVFGMSEGYYGCKDCYQHALGNITEASDKESLEFEANGIRKSYTLSTLSRIKTVERAIKQTQAAVNRRRNSINSKLQSSQELHAINAQRELLKIKISVLKTELQSQQRNMDALEKEASSYKKDLFIKRKEMDEKNDERRKLEEKCLELSKFYCEFRESLLKTEAQLNVRRKALISELCCIYPIVEFPDHNGFSIHDVFLPNSENFSGHDETMIAISLGYVCHMLLMISQFLNVPLRYSIHFYGSRSCITDHISSTLPEKTREFPLYSKGKDKRCFEYGVFLLNKNIAQLRIYSGLTTRDLSFTLPNLSSLIESRLSANSEARGIYIAPSKAQPSDINLVLSDKISQNGFSNQSTEVDLPPSQNLLKPSDSEFEILRREMHAMLPNSSVNSHNGLQLPLLSKDASGALSCSLDKGLNDIKLLEKSYDSIKREEKEPPVRTALHVNYLQLTSHHSSYPNLNAPLQVSETFSVDSQLPSTPPRVWTAESSRTNSEDEPVEDRPKIERQNTVLNDSIFYIPSQLTVDSDLTANMCERIEKAIIEDDFTADLSMRAEQLVSKKSSFQMQRLQPSTTDEEPLC